MSKRRPMFWLVMHTTRGGKFLCGNAKITGDDLVVTAAGGGTASAPVGGDVMAQARALLLELYGNELSGRA